MGYTALLFEIKFSLTDNSTSREIAVYLRGSWKTLTSTHQSTDTPQSFSRGSSHQNLQQRCQNISWKCSWKWFKATYGRYERPAEGGMRTSLNHLTEANRWGWLMTIVCDWLPTSFQHTPIIKTLSAFRNLNWTVCGCRPVHSAVGNSGKKVRTHEADWLLCVIDPLFPSLISKC